jgi:NitT/TauT family transport system ATP-binding protein
MASPRYTPEEPRMIEPLPSTGISRILALCEVLDDHGGTRNVYQLCWDLHLPFGELLLVIKSAEMLALIERADGDPLLNALGKRLRQVSTNEQKALLKEQMLKLNVFQHIVKLLQNAADHQVPAQVILEELAVLLPQEQPRQLFTTLLNWGRFGEVFGYSRNTNLLSLQRPDGEAAT